MTVNNARTQSSVAVAGMHFTDSQLALAIVVFVTALRVSALFLLDHELAPDEAQYWSWAQEPAFGYFSKPPMIAWIIAATTGLFGDIEAAVRLASPLLHGATALVVFALARSMYSERVALWSATIYVTAPAVWFSSGLITTDVPLLLFWSVALLAFRETLRSRNTAWAFVLGLALGLGLLSKYAMVYFVLCAVLFSAVSAEDRWLITSRCGLVAVVVAAIVFAPNAAWNVANGMSTVQHTATNASWGGELFRLEKLLEFIGGQFGVFGPLMFGAFVVRLATLRRRDLKRETVLLLCFSLPVLLIVATQAFISRANANWAVSAYIAATILVVAWIVEGKGRRGWVLPVSVGLHVATGIILGALIASPAAADRLGLANAFKRVRGWDELGERVAAATTQDNTGQPYSAVLTNDRETHAELRFYAKGRLPALANWDYDGVPQHHFELTAPLKAEHGARVLFVARYEQEARDAVRARFERSEALGALEIPIGGERVRTRHLYALEGIIEGETVGRDTGEQR